MRDLDEEFTAEDNHIAWARLNVDKVAELLDLHGPDDCDHDECYPYDDFNREREEAFDEGYTEGYNEGLEDGKDAGKENV